MFKKIYKYIFNFFNLKDIVMFNLFIDLYIYIYNIKIYIIIHIIYIYIELIKFIINNKYMYVFIY